MALYPKFRDVHLYVGLALLVPIVIVSATGVLLNHEEALRLKSGPRPKGLPAGADGPPPVAAAAAQPGSFEAGAGLSERYAADMEQAVGIARRAWGRAAPLDRVELKHDARLGVVVKVKAARGAGVSPEEIIWSPLHGQEAVMHEGAGKWIKDLHTGKLFSRAIGFLWSDISALAILLLSMTGVVLYVIPVWKKASKAKHRPAGAPSAGAKPSVPRAAEAPQVPHSQPS